MSIEIVEVKKYEFEDGSIGVLNKIGNTYQIRSNTKFRNLNTSNYSEALRLYDELCNCRVLEVQDN